MGISCFKQFVCGVGSFFKVGLAIAIAVIVSTKLWDVEINSEASGTPFVIKSQCLMGSNLESGTVCEYAYAVCGVSLLVSLCASLFLCLTCDLCGLGTWLEFVVHGLQTAWWVVASIIFWKKAREANDQGLPREDWRDAVAVMACVAALLGAIMAFACLLDACKCLANCFCCCGGSDRDYRKRGANAV
ncbi:hypothetical protein TSOC_010593 [Tetrabaena socialis]|uniref:MARVEL domain-containing protein n=1 Tax=Tetrabaena socialis TaxID=47790 RepID=A0A2J7ZSW0_9CHLO|nr:hypothetical protein TSOC_010593 [Tetrabaena socialis]|eukprot:PNH03364.1 hypothetical protein TSOC_010593 [Tetrabaena socialis]